VWQAHEMQTTLNRACLPIQHGKRKSQKWMATWPSGSRLTQPSSCPVVSCRHALAGLTPQHHCHLRQACTITGSLHKCLWAGLCSVHKQGQEHGATVFSYMTGHWKAPMSQVCKSWALGCAAASAMQACSYSILVKPFKELRQRGTELPKITILSQMHTAIQVVYARLKPYQRSLTSH